MSAKKPNQLVHIESRNGRRPDQPWKMVESEFAAGVLDGRIRIGTLEAYANLENGRRDPGDGAVTYIQSRALFGEDAREAAILQRLGLGAVGVAVGNRVIQRHVPVHVFCMMEPHCNYDPDTRKPKPRKAIFRVTNIRGLAERIVELYPERFTGRVMYDRVLYRRRELDAVHGTFERANPFVKAPGFQREREVRIVWQLQPQYKAEAFVTGPDAKLGSFFELLRGG